MAHQINHKIDFLFKYLKCYNNWSFLNCKYYCVVLSSFGETDHLTTRWDVQAIIELTFKLHDFAAPENWSKYTTYVLLVYKTPCHLAISWQSPKWVFNDWQFDFFIVKILLVWIHKQLNRNQNQNYTKLFYRIYPRSKKHFVIPKWNQGR